MDYREKLGDFDWSNVVGKFVEGGFDLGAAAIQAKYAGMTATSQEQIARAEAQIAAYNAQVAQAAAAAKAGESSGAKQVITTGIVAAGGLLGLFLMTR